jgi:ATP-dependent protease ClpP protease subunit
MLKFFNKLDNNEYELILSGEVGWEINGKEIADEIRYLNSIKATKIIERINSGGGDVISAFDIIDANLNSDAIIETIITGVAASSAGWIAASGSQGHRKVVDYGKGMIHDPSIWGVTLEEMEEGKDKNTLLSIKDSIVTIFSNMTGKTKEEISLLMTNETWYGAEMWVQEGFADKVINTVKKPILTENMSIANMVNACENFAKDIKLNKVTMDKLTIILN